ncbi:peptide-methionine (S)-S-oxide reductase MsrA [Gilvimarinus sp. 1_MG-2023]|uniref:peptide-methionine (S)-S-oxide reductase MsrA n=1 Tax=Gilvimarinus sp. 1_MG-2023 TaxID=3062638 RepID=UPI0026E287DD|nr:peptide-methionine (S)-S-oxide reductase MsrA [Gilvimarinus sp. 1_MG-2023]MDO6745815.1 peptide-methionine (S)-S-oxide reductase MsrA [Gilvimarinus sp. 1_MG-2023]
MNTLNQKLHLPTPEQALPGREQSLAVDSTHFVTGESIKPPFQPNSSWFLLGMGCFWGAERLFWQTPGVISTAVGYSAGFTPNPTYEEVCSGLTGHNEVVLVVYEPASICFEDLLALFWQSHDPTQGMRQGNDRGTQYRSGLYLSTAEQMDQALNSKQSYQRALSAVGFGGITTEILRAGQFYYAETYHQQYLAKNPSGYCGIGGTGVVCPGA